MTKIDKVFSLIEEKISSQEYKKYFANLNYDENLSDDENVVFTTPNIIISKWIETKYLKLIEHFFEVVYGKKVKVIVTAKNTKSKDTVKPSQKSSLVVLNPIYTFENFIVGPSNQMAYALCESISKKLALEYNPLFIYSDSGLGKTHLLHAIGNKVIESYSNVIYVTSEEFINDFINNIKNKTTDQFRQKYRECDYLLIDDIQFLSGKEQTQEEFFHTFNELHANGKQIVLTSDKPPKKIAGFEKRLKTRFEWGIQVGIMPPELDTKLAIIEKKSELNNIVLSHDIVEFIAINLGDNVRELEGAINSISSFSKILHQEITLDFVKKVLKDHIKESKTEVTIEDIVEVVAKELNVKPADIKSKKRHKAVSDARRIVIYLARELIKDNSTLFLARYFNMKDHSSISKNLKRMKELLDDENFKTKVENIKSIVLKG